MEFSQCFNLDPEETSFEALGSGQPRALAKAGSCSGGQARATSQGDIGMRPQRPKVAKQAQRIQTGAGTFNLRKIYDAPMELAGGVAQLRRRNSTTLSGTTQASESEQAARSDNCSLLAAHLNP